MKLLASLLIVWFSFHGLLGENVIDNKVSNNGTISTLEISSTEYNISFELSLIHEQDDFIFGTEEKGSFVVSPEDDHVKAFGYIEDGRFIGQFTYDSRTYLVQEGGKLVAWNQVEGLIAKEPLCYVSLLELSGRPGFHGGSGGRGEPGWDGDD